MTAPINLNVNVTSEPTRNSVEVNAETTEVSIVEEETEVLIVTEGIQGQRGYGWLSGEGPPEPNDGRIGDFYVDTVANSFWGPKTASGWGVAPFYIPGTPQRHIHTQATPSDTWVINHPLDGYPSVMVVDSASTVVIGEVSYVSTSQVVVEFTAPFSGFAYLT